MHNCRFKRCSCMNNCMNTFAEDVFETKCNNMPNCDVCNDSDSCACGFDEEEDVFPSNPMLGQSYVPFQVMDKTFKPCVGLKHGTIFPELVSPYSPCQSIEENCFIEKTNKIGEGCNKC